MRWSFKSPSVAAGVPQPCGFDPLNFRHPEYGKSIGWETSIGEVFGTLGCSPQMTVTPTNPVNECYGDFTLVIAILRLGSAEA